MPRYLCLKCNHIFESEKSTEERICPKCLVEKEHALMSLSEPSDFYTMYDEPK